MWRGHSCEQSISLLICWQLEAVLEQSCPAENLVLHCFSLAVLFCGNRNSELGAPEAVFDSKKLSRHREPYVLQFSRSLMTDIPILTGNSPSQKGQSRNVGKMKGVRGERSSWHQCVTQYYNLSLVILFFCIFGGSLFAFLFCVLLGNHWKGQTPVDPN